VADKQLIYRGAVFVWDEDKQRSNMYRHGLNFRDALSAFFDPFFILRHDHRHSAEEDRYNIIGKTDNERLIFIVYTLRGLETLLISARKANKFEVELYEKQ
jgi:uncharacterized DUF497 family protein